MDTRIKIRGIYSTALTKLALDWGYSISQPSSWISQRFHLEQNSKAFDLFIQDREDHQGIEVTGESERICQFWTFLQERLLDAALVELLPDEEDDSLVKGKLEFPGISKEVLDKVRLSVVPTVRMHHRLRAIDAKTLEAAESHLAKHPEDKEDIERKLFLEKILLPLEKTGSFKLEHVRPSGRAMRPREGVIVKSSGKKMVFKRFFSNGRYDGLDIPIQPGDYGLTEIEEGQWFVKHSYFTRAGKLIGEYYNINTPVEFYPYGARYMDLEVDVIRRAGEAPFLIDREKLGILAQQGCISEALETKALQVAENLLR